MAQVTEKVSIGEAVPLSELQIFDTFGWLLNKDQIQLHAAWVKAAFSSGGSSTTTSRPSSSAAGESAATPTSAKKKRTATGLASSTMALFRKD